MAIHFPDHCRNTTAGALRQVKATGSTTAGGGLFSKDMVISMMQSGHANFLKPREPVGKHMSALAQAKTDIDNTTDAISESSRRMVENAKDATEVLTDASRKMRDGTEKLGVAMAKFTAIFQDKSFAEQARSAESLVNSLERLALLEEKGQLAKVFAALK